ncbi:DUF3999 domain-containing protein [Pseudocitrobacter faecalis]|uniref:Uncharacterized protein DUF3999 n=1 Tax=Pseudocitrobacter faecalis TaxID=1398493 RepID=A0ABX9FRQ8_9ENTR|nr:uncharacterized protein DUF3999 [Pseudocitrobacter faecalis]
MKRIKAIVCSVLLMGSFLAIAAESPRDYATGMTLETSSSSPWYRVALPREVYQHSAWPDLRDVRVFNQQGERVPFTLMTNPTPPAVADSVALRLFPLAASPLASTDASAPQTIRLKAANGVEINLQGDEAKSVGQSYLLTLPDSREASLRLTQLRLDWAASSANWQGKASVYASRDLSHWQRVQENAPLMDLSRDGDRLKLNTVAAELTLSPEGRRYLLLVLDPQTPVPALKSVMAVAQPQEPLTERIQLPAAAVKNTSTEAIWRWDRPQPLSTLSIMLMNEGVLPVDITWRSDEKSEWRPLAKSVLFNVNDQTQEAFPLSGNVVEAIRITTVDAHLPQTLPRVTGEREAKVLVFNAQGKGPYMLAWGNKAAENAALSLNQLIPESLTASKNVETLPWAQPLEAVKLGGEARLQAVSAGEQQKLWVALAVWAVLIVGVGALLIVAWRIWREVRR